MLERLKSPLLDQALEAGFWPIEGRLYQGGCRGIEIQGRLLRQHWRIPMPTKHQVGCPEVFEISWKVEQESKIIQLAELHPTTLEAHQHIHHRFTATGQLFPLLRRRPVDIQTPGFNWVWGRSRRWFRLDRVWRQITCGLQEFASQGVKPVLARH